jgi:anti-sigma regulatory factor (Ser/Thr protein kinase)
VALQVADHTALCVDNARRYTREHSVAAIVQRQLLPRSPAENSALETAYLTVSALGGGAWYDTIDLPGARTALVVGEVAGHGIHATATMGQLRTVIRSLAALGLEPDELLARLNDTAELLAAERALLPMGDPLHGEQLTADCLFAVHDPLTRTCTVAVAGDLAPVLLRPGAAPCIPDVPAGPRLGDAQGTPFAATVFDVPEGSVLALSNATALVSHLTEGFAARLRTYCSGDESCDRAPARGERAAGDDSGRERERAEMSLQELCDSIMYEAPPIRDDVVLLIARTRRFPADRVATWPLDSDPEAVGAAREHVRDRLAAWRTGADTAFDTELIVSELVTNAIRYGTPPLELRLIRDRALTCEVRDSSHVAPHLRHARTADEGGRGLFIVAQLAQSWGTRYTAEGKTIWAEQHLPPLG